MPDPKNTVDADLTQDLDDIEKIAGEVVATIAALKSGNIAVIGSDVATLIKNSKAALKEIAKTYIATKPALKETLGDIKDLWDDAKHLV